MACNICHYTCHHHYQSVCLRSVVSVRDRHSQIGRTHPRGGSLLDKRWWNPGRCFSELPAVCVRISDITPAPNLCLVLKSLMTFIHQGRGENQQVLHQSVSQFETFALKTTATEGETSFASLLWFGCIWVVKGNKCLLLQIPWDLSVISRRGRVVWCGGNTCSDAQASQAFPKAGRVQI